MKEIIKVQGMMCANCEKRVNRALQEIDGVQQVVADANQGVVCIEFDEIKTNVAKLQEIIEDVGYEVVK